MLSRVSLPIVLRLILLDTKNIDMKNLMTKEEVQTIVDEVYPKIEKHYGTSKFHNCTPYVELHHNIYLRIIGEDLEMNDDDYPTEVEEFGECDPAAEFDRDDNTIVVYHPKMKDRKDVIQINNLLTLNQNLSALKGFIS